MILEVASLLLPLFIFRAAPSSVAAIRLNRSASPVQEVSAMIFLSKTGFCNLLFISIPYYPYMVDGRLNLSLISNTSNYPFIPLSNILLPNKIGMDLGPPPIRIIFITDYSVTMVQPVTPSSAN